MPAPPATPAAIAAAFSWLIGWHIYFIAIISSFAMPR
jgi:hypothetical protein